MPFERLCLQGDLPAPGHMRAFALGAHEICIANQAGQLAAFDNLCPHRGAPLAEGSVEAGAVVCPLHAWAFHLQTGQAEGGGPERLTLYQLRLEGDLVLAQPAPEPTDP